MKLQPRKPRPRVPCHWTLCSARMRRTKATPTARLPAPVLHPRGLSMCVCQELNNSLAIADLPLPRSLLHRARAVAMRNPSHLQRRSANSFIISFRRRRVSGGTSARVSPSPSVSLQVLQDCARSLLQAGRCWLLHSHWSRSDGRWPESISGMLACLHVFFQTYRN